MKTHSSSNTKGKQEINDWCKSHPSFSKSEWGHIKELKTNGNFSDWTRVTESAHKDGIFTSIRFCYILALGMWIFAEWYVSVSILVLFQAHVSASRPRPAERQPVLFVFRYLLVSFSQVLSLKWKHPEDFKFGLKWFLWRRQKRARRVCSFALPLRGVFILFTGFTKNRSCWAIYWNRTASFHFFFPFLLLSLLSLSPSLSSFLSFFFSSSKYSLSFIKHLLWGIHCITHLN